MSDRAQRDRIANALTFMQRGAQEWPYSPNIEDRRGAGAFSRLMDELGWSHPIEVMTREQRMRDYMTPRAVDNALAQAGGFDDVDASIVRDRQQAAAVEAAKQARLMRWAQQNVEVPYEASRWTGTDWWSPPRSPL